ncbi:hypothetical protein A3H75_00835 [Candidatus Uhrbacteria bacterium RIFCSPLOWO2_02_FULL_51_9]|uniref:Uncharacterized protein n=1 Tax=Candidatus Uhrbacteria bacterium RIFCSPLOWO2_02_FULL_51_9 TaxID=1802410 RepID=A0A1F7VF76_9BACT|nr:MAG: hypothetical protein A3H75_00835 [Candidatus Uhrbacteria bacterium RIFCSPLOWO2_02_FULL_51_9]
MNKPSGYNFQYEIEDRVKNKGWVISSEQSYIDDVELKPRKVDFVASQQRESHNPRGNQVVLVVECKYLDHDAKFWFRDNPKNHKAYFVDGYDTENLFIDESRFHFFSPAKVAVNEEGAKTMYEAIMQASKGLLYLRSSPQMLCTKGLFYPVVVYKGPGKICDQDGNPVKDILYYHQYSWRDPKTQDITTRSLYVDIIHESDLEKYLDDVFKKEMNRLMDHVSFQRQMEEQRRIEEDRRREHRRNEAI